MIVEAGLACGLFCLRREAGYLPHPLRFSAFDAKFAGWGIKAAFVATRPFRIFFGF